MFGWRKRIGFISPSVLEVIPYDFYHFAPDGIGLVGVTCNIEGWSDDQYDTALATVERDLKKPVVASDPADFWSAFRALGVRDQIAGYGKLLASLAADASIRESL
jgi:maleate cis-trans isomerase